jgi:hypothetical protein
VCHIRSNIEKIKLQDYASALPVVGPYCLTARGLQANHVKCLTCRQFPITIRMKGADTNFANFEKSLKVLAHLLIVRVSKKIAFIKNT